MHTRNLSTGWVIYFHNIFTAKVANFSVSMVFFVPVIYLAVELSWQDHSDEELRNKFENLLSANLTEI